MLPASERIFQATEIEKLVGIPAPRLAKFIESPGYGIKPSLRQKAGRGAPRLYSLDDLLAIALAWWLFKAGFRSKVIGRALLQPKATMAMLRDSQHWTPQQRRDHRFLVVKREIKAGDKTGQEVSILGLEPLVQELRSNSQHTFQVIPFGALLSDLWEGIAEHGKA